MWRTKLRSGWAVAVIGLLVGAVVGLVVYHGSKLQGEGLFVLCGTTAGGVAAIVIHGYARSFRLTEVTFSVPQFSNVKFAVTRDNKVVAWRLFVETVTRVTLQPLDERGGIVREALDSLYMLFGTTREILATAEPSRRTGNVPTIEHLAIAMLNTELRPFLSMWHPRLRAWEQEHPGEPETVWPDNEQCRRELAAMQARLVRYAAGFGELGGVANIQDIIGSPIVPARPSSTVSPVE